MGSRAGLVGLQSRRVPPFHVALIGRYVMKVPQSEPLKPVLLVLMLAIPVLVSLSACSTSGEFPETAANTVCTVACTLDDADCEYESMRECVL